MPAPSRRVDPGLRTCLSHAQRGPLRRPHRYRNVDSSAGAPTAPQPPWRDGGWRRSTRRIAARLAVAAGLLVVSALASASPPCEFHRVEGPPPTSGQPGVQASGGTAQPAVSSNGGVLAFRVPSGSNLAGGASGAQVLALDVRGGSIDLVSTTATGAPSAAATTNDHPVVSATGRYVAFETTSSTYTGGIAGVHVVRIDRTTREAVVVDVTPGGGLVAGTTARVGGLSGDGRFVVFSSNAAGLVAGDPGSSTFAVFVRDLASGTTERIDVTPTGGPGDGGAFGERPTLSGDGRFVAFASSATNLLGSPVSGSSRIYVRDRQTATTVQASIGPGGSDLGGARHPAISDDGTAVLFGSADGGATPTQLWLRPLAQAAAVAIPAAADMGLCDGARVGRDGTVVAQCRRTGNLPAQAFVWSLRQPGVAPRLISAVGGVAGNALAGSGITIAADNTVVAFDADASDLVPGDTNDARDSFAYIDPRLRMPMSGDGFEPACTP